MDHDRAVGWITTRAPLKYLPSARGSTPGVAVLEHPQTHDRVAVARTPDGQWLFASLPDYKAPDGGEPGDRTRERLRHCIAQTRDKGSVVEFVQHCERVGGRPEPSVDQVRDAPLPAAPSVVDVEDLRAKVAVKDATR